MIHRWKNWIGVAMILLPGLVQAGRVATFRRQVLAGPEGPSFWNDNIVLADLDADGRVEILKASPSGNIYLYHQAENGFCARPTQTWRLPANTVWIAVMDIDSDGKMEIFTSSGEGLAYFRPEGHGFNPKAIWLVHEKTVFADSTCPPAPWLWLNNGKEFPPLSVRIGAVYRDYAVIYKCNGRGKFTPGEKTSLAREWSMEKYLPVYWKEYARWGLGNSESKYLALQTSVCIRPNKKMVKDEGIESLCDAFKHDPKIQASEIEREDINGDGRPDAVLWYMSRDLDPRVTWSVYLRKPDGTLPVKPDQILRTRGWPLFYIGSKSLVNIDGRGTMGLIHREMKSTAFSAKSFLEMVMSNGLEWTIAIQKYNPGKGFSVRPDFKLNITATFMGWKSINLEGDFNGDHRPDLMVQRTPGYYDVYLSTGSGDWFERVPQIHFETPREGMWMDLQDYNHDAICDLLTIDAITGELVIFLSQPCEKESVK